MSNFRQTSHQQDIPAVTLPEIGCMEYVQQLAPLFPEDQKPQPGIELTRRINNIIDELNLLGLGSDACLAATLHQLTHQTPIDKQLLVKKLNMDAANLYQRICAMDAISSFSGSNRTEGQVTVENLRRMLLAMVDDIRVVLVKLVEQLVLLREGKHNPDSDRQLLAQQTLDVFAPLANRLGVWQLKWELEDLSLHYLKNDEYKKLARLLAERRVDREKYIELFLKQLKQALAEQNIKADVNGRPKHIYSIWRKMQLKNLDFEQIFDVRAVRILVDNVSDCYTALGVVHTRWPNIASEFDDYIAVPKDNGYSSIHTAVVGGGGKVMEVQIRTHEMHQENELGVAAHWRYKEGMSDFGLDKKILWLRQLLEWKDEISSASDNISEFKTQAIDERVYVFTPKGEVIDLPIGATPIDFAYAIHTQVGHRCRGAKINGRIVPLSYKLQTGEQIDVLTVKTGGPSRDWLMQDNNFVMTSRARARIQHWFKDADRDLNISDGRKVLERELHRQGINEVNFEKLAQTNKFKKVDDLLAAIGSGDIKISQVVSQFKPVKSEKAHPIGAKRSKKISGSQDAIRIEGVGNLLNQMAKCCNPVPGDEIIGFITLGRGVSIHRKDCGNILRLDSNAIARLIQVDWGQQTKDLYRSDIQIKAYDRQGLLNDITLEFVNEKINLVRVDLITDVDKHFVNVTLTVEVSDTQSLNNAITKIQNISNVIDVKRAAEH